MLVPREVRRRLLGARTVAVGSLGALVLLGTTVPSSHATHPVGDEQQAVDVARIDHGRPRVSGDAATDTVRITQANLKSGQALANFNADAATVLGEAPDFITYNEVPFRSDTTLAPPPGYALWRTPGQYQGETPVAWRADRWTMVAEGTTMLSNRKGRLPGQHVDWGVRYANWVTLQDAYARTISVVSAHLAPVIATTEGLQPIEVNRLGALTTTLGAAGPVLVGGDFNMSYLTSAYLRDLFTAYNLVPSYDALGAHFPTGDHYGATIDYLMLHQDLAAPQLAFTDQFATELNSDHNAVTADLTYVAPATAPPYSITPGTVVSDPDGTPSAQRAVLQMMVSAVQHAPPKSAIHLVTRTLSTPTMVKALDDAIARGVHVQIIIRHKTLNKAAHHFMNQLGSKPWRKSFALRCDDQCRKFAVRHNQAPTVMLISDVVTTRAVRIVSDHAVSVGANKAVTTARVSTTQNAYDQAFRRFFNLAGHPLG